MDLLNQDQETREDLGMLAVMDVLVTEEQVTQRELSRRTGLNLKKVNYCLHKLLEKGHVKFQRVVHNPDKRAYLYVLTPAGLRAKSRLTYSFLNYTLNFYNQIEDRFRKCFAAMARSGVKKLLLYGASDATKIVLSLVHDENIQVVAICDGPNAMRQQIEEVRVDGESNGDNNWDGILITALEDHRRLEDELRSLGLSEERIWKLS